MVDSSSFVFDGISLTKFSVSIGPSKLRHILASKKQLRPGYICRGRARDPASTAGDGRQTTNP